MDIFSNNLESKFSIFLSLIILKWDLLFYVEIQLKKSFSPISSYIELLKISVSVKRP